MIALSLLLTAASPAACPVAKLTPAERAADSAVIRRMAGQPVRGSEISEVMARGRWKAVWATPREAERGVYFLRRDNAGRWQNAGVWGGVIAPEERLDTVAWAMDRGRDFPAPLANCFADALLAGK